MKKGTDLLQYLQGFDNISCRSYSSPTGEIYICGDDRSLKAIAFSSRLSNKNRYDLFFKRKKGLQVELAEKFLDLYFQGSIHEIDVKISLLQSKKNETTSLRKELLLDISRFTGNEQKVYGSLMRVGPGKTVSYGELAEKSGMPGAARFAGTAMAKNLFPIIIPCHRVIKSNGSRGYYSGGVGIKDFLLDHEAD
jgi:methylated-DNA-[protein]-cysteine S-methyltransferase